MERNTDTHTRELPWIQSSLPFMGMVTAVVALAINVIITKAAMSKGSSFYVLCVYSNLLATLVLFPTAFLFHRSKWPRLTFSVLWRIFLLASCGCFAEIGGNAGLKYGSPTLATAMSNIIPAFTYILALVFRMEGLNWRRLSSICKLVGTVVSIAGAFIVTFYNGPAILNKPLNSKSHVQLILSSQQNWILGGFLMAFACFLTALWCILQAFILKMYPAEMIVIAFYCLFVTVQSLLVSVIAERDVSAWRIEANMGLVAVLYTAIINIAYRLYVTAWCLSRTGPLFVSLFKPLTVVIAVVISVFFMKDVLYFGSLVGALVVIIGFYCVMWGKAKEGGLNKGIESSNHEALLLLPQETEDV